MHNSKIMPLIQSERLLLLKALVLLLLFPCGCAVVASVSDGQAAKAEPRPSSSLSSSFVAHLIPHSHCDAAYKKTFEEYYETEVRNVLSTIVREVKGRSEGSTERRFVWAETIYLTKWWNDERTTDQERSDFAQIHREGRLEIVNGGWVMHDEAITRYDSQIHQMSLGHSRLEQLLVRPNKMPGTKIASGWQIDPFGPSSFDVDLHAQAGFQILVLNRVPEHIKQQMRSNQTLQFTWQTPRGSSMLVHVMDTHYGSPIGFDWENLEHPSETITEDNLRPKCDEYMAVLAQRSEYYRTDQLLVPFGEDFRFQDSRQFDNMDQMITFINGHPELYNGSTLRYSTVEDYRQALLLSLYNTTDSLPVVTDSRFLPLWAGYYTQLPSLKQMVRTCEVVLQTCEVHLVHALQYDGGGAAAGTAAVTAGAAASASTAGTGKQRSGYLSWLNGLEKRLHSARETVGLMQHHDALPATSYRFVFADYMKRLTSVYNNLSNLLSTLIEGPGPETDYFRYDASDWNDKRDIVGGGPYIGETMLVRGVNDAKSIHIDKILAPQMGMPGIPLTVVNSLVQPVRTVASFVCTRPDIAIVFIDNKSGHTIPIESQATPMEHEVRSADLGLFLISFLVDMAQFEKVQFEVRVCDWSHSTDQHPPEIIPNLMCATNAQLFDGSTLFSSRSQLDFDPDTNDVSTLTVFYPNQPPIVMKLEHDVILYDGQNDTIYNMLTSVESSDPSPLLQSHKRKIIRSYQGPIFSDVTLGLTEWLTIRYRVFHSPSSPSDLDGMIQVTMLNGPLPPNVNVASRFKTDLAKPTGWFIDENGSNPVPAQYNRSMGVGDGNCRPLVSRSWLEGDDDEQHSARKRRFTIFTVDPRGVVSTKDGSMDVFWSRRNNSTNAWWARWDWWKEGEDLSTTRSSIWLSLSSGDGDGDDGDGDDGDNEDILRLAATKLANDVVLVQGAVPQKDNQNRYPFNSTIPDYVHIVTMRLSSHDDDVGTNSNEMWVDMQVENLSVLQPAIVDLKELLYGMKDLVVDAAGLYTITYLRRLDDDDDDATSGCSLKATQGGLAWFLTMQERRICSVRVPMIPKTTMRHGGTTEADSIRATVS